MTATLKVDLSPFGKAVRFEMVYDPMFTQERTLALCLQQMGTCEPELTHAMLRIIRPGDTVADVGAAVGFFTILMSKLVGPQGTVYAFEPDERNLARLRMNIDLNEAANVRLVAKPVSDVAGEILPFFLAKDSGDNSLSEVSVLHRLIELEATSLDCYDGVRHASFIKVDVEGAENRVMLGAFNALHGQVPFFSLELNEAALERAKSSRQQLREFMRTFGYDGWLMQHNGNMPWHIPLQTKLTGGPANLNMLFATPASIAAHWPEIKL